MCSLFHHLDLIARYFTIYVVDMFILGVFILNAFIFDHLDLLARHFTMYVVYFDYFKSIYFK